MREYKEMVNEEIYVLTKHANFDSNFVENLPVYRRRFFLTLLEKENEMLEKEKEKILYKNG